MEQINGKTLVFTDFHIGLKNGSKSRLEICISVIKEIIQKIKSDNIDNVIFAGDWHHCRNSTENNVMNVSYKLMTALLKCCKVYCILGNHDLYMKNSTEIHSLVMFKNLKNVIIVDKPTEVSLNGNKTLFVPWLGDTSVYSKESFDMLFGHFDVSHQYLIKSYIEEHSAKPKTNSALQYKIRNDDMLKSDKSSLGDMIGDFVDIAKKDGVIFTGHIHQHKEVIAKGRKFIFIGDPYQLNLGEREYECGYYLIYSDNSYEFNEIKSVPKHVELKMSNVTKDFEKFDFSSVKGNILHKIYDIEVDSALDAKISQRINDLQPYEELLPDYEVDLECNAEIKMQNASIDLIKKSKMDYVKSYIDNIDKKLLEEQDLNPDKLYLVLSDYYNRITEEK